MKPLIIIALAFVLLIPLSVFAQEESLSDLTDRLDEENLQKAQDLSPDVPLDPMLQQKSLDCPPGTYYGLDNQNNPTCRDIDTNQIVDPNTGIMTDSQTGEIILDDNQLLFIGIGVVVLIIILGIAKAASKKSKPASLPRRGWTEPQHREVLTRQNGRCNICGQVSGTFQFDHIDDNHNNNDLYNCQALCPNCHDRKSRGLN